MLNPLVLERFLRHIAQNLCEIEIHRRRIIFLVMHDEATVSRHFSENFAIDFFPFADRFEFLYSLGGESRNRIAPGIRQSRF